VRWLLGISFLSVAVWALFPDRYEGDDRNINRSGAFPTTLVAFFLAEIGDKTQIATIGLAARFEQFYPVVLGTTLGMMLANIPAVVIGARIADKLPVRAIRITAAAVFAGLGVLTLAGGGG
jgi:putative Ca2+/H+ antiporter (TMEM165/GDT1 family)